MLIAAFIISVVIAFGGGVLWTKLRYLKHVKKIGCPFKYACLKYDEIETKEAVRRVLTLLVDNKVSKEEIKQLITKTLT